MIVLTVMSALSCTSANELAVLETEIAANRVEILALRKDTPTKQELTDLREAILEAILEVRELDEDLQGDVSGLTSRIRQLESKLEDTNFRLKQLTQQIAATNQELQGLRAEAERVRLRPPAPQPEQPAPPPPRNPEEVYADAYDHYRESRDDDAIDGFRRFLETYPSHELTDNALYWTGESYYRLGRFQKAISYFDQVLERFEASERGPSALLKKGLAYLALDQRAQGELHLRRVVCEHPGTDEARLARQRLQELGIDVTC